MKIITVIAERVSAEALATALPAEGVASVSITGTQSFSRTASAVESYRGRKIPRNFTAVHRIEIAIEDDAVEQTVRGIEFVRGAGLLGDARAWISAQAENLFAAPGATLAMTA